MQVVEVIEGNSAVILAMPHSGDYIPANIWNRLNDTGKKCADTDWHIPKLYENLLPQANIIKANFHRYVIDVNRAPDNTNLYLEHNSTALCPITDFQGNNIWLPGKEPTEDDITTLITQFYTPYHQALRGMIDKIFAKYGFVILYDCHSIRSRLPFLFSGELPALNIGTNDGKSCASAIEQCVLDICVQSPFSYVLNGRFRGGWTTRHYGKPQHNIHAIQMEIAQSAYMNECEPWQYDASAAKQLRDILAIILARLDDMRLSDKQFIT